MALFIVQNMHSFFTLNFITATRAHNACYLLSLLTQVWCLTGNSLEDNCILLQLKDS